MIPPRPTMTPEDVKALREFFDSPDGKRVLGQIQSSYEARSITDTQPEAFWCPSPPGSSAYPLDAEMSNETPPDSSRMFRPIYEEQAPRVSYWPAIIVIGLLLVGWIFGSIYYLTIGRHA